jgi:hypothetical protein
MLVSGKQSGYWELFLRVKQLGREADYSPPCSTEVRNDGIISPLRHMSSWLSASIRCRDNLHFTFVMTMKNNRGNIFIFKRFNLLIHLTSEVRKWDR